MEEEVQATGDTLVLAMVGHPNPLGLALCLGCVVFVTACSKLTDLFATYLDSLTLKTKLK